MRKVGALARMNRQAHHDVKRARATRLRIIEFLQAVPIDSAHTNLNKLFSSIGKTVSPNWIFKRERDIYLTFPRE